MRAKAVITAAVAFGLLSTGNASSQVYTNSHPWIKKWKRYDVSAYKAIKPAAYIFKANPWTLRAIVDREGGNVVPFKLKRSLCTGSQPGWNKRGSRAFGPAQFMLDSKPACRGDWGTFGTWDDAAFLAAKKKGHPIPFRFKTPASNVGQMLVTAYMITHPHTGGLSHWCASMC
jgi:hypothetical protein